MRLVEAGVTGRLANLLEIGIGAEQGDVVGQGYLQRRRLLADQRDMPVAHGIGHVLQCQAANLQFAALRVHVARQQVQQGALAGA